MPREKAFKREAIEHLLSLNGGKIVDTDSGWRRTLNMGRREFERVFGKKQSSVSRSVYQIADKII